VNAIDLTSALGKLLSDPSLREAFALDSKLVAQKLALRKEDFAAFVSLDPMEIEVQAQTLIKKRLHGVRQLLPKTFTALQNDSVLLFEKYAPTYWPEGQTRYIQDANHFMNYLIEKKDSRICKLERNFLHFNFGRQHLACHFITNSILNGKRRNAFQVLYRGPTQATRQLVLFFQFT
jgi:hypothetical protein